MHNQRGFIGFGVLIAIVVGLIVAGGGAYYVVQQRAPTQTVSENSDNLQVRILNNKLMYAYDEQVNFGYELNIPNSQWDYSKQHYLIAHVVRDGKDNTLKIGDSILIKYLETVTQGDKVIALKRQIDSPNVQGEYSLYAPFENWLNISGSFNGNLLRSSNNAEADRDFHIEIYVAEVIDNGAQSESAVLATSYGSPPDARVIATITSGSFIVHQPKLNMDVRAGDLYDPATSETRLAILVQHEDECTSYKLSIYDPAVLENRFENKYTPPSNCSSGKSLENEYNYILRNRMHTGFQERLNVLVTLETDIPEEYLPFMPHSYRNGLDTKRVRVMNLQSKY